MKDLRSNTLRSSTTFETNYLRCSRANIVTSEFYWKNKQYLCITIATLLILRSDKPGARAMSVIMLSLCLNRMNLCGTNKVFRMFCQRCMRIIVFPIIFRWEMPFPNGNGKKSFDTAISRPRSSVALAFVRVFRNELGLAVAAVEIQSVIGMKRDSIDTISKAP